MSDFSLFIAGVCVTIIWSAGVGSLLWAAYQGGKSERHRKQALEDQPPA
ncbi:MAG: hypothetical protein HKP41_10405 [Desulfobacterales bacterium]|nr:hypothetical protein [Deltaproteobacteria bacterium]NNK94749.1 hypothetical protein [Desulfobacterales bacterium]